MPVRREEDEERWAPGVSKLACDTASSYKPPRLESISPSFLGTVSTAWDAIHLSVANFNILVVAEQGADGPGQLRAARLVNAACIDSDLLVPVLLGEHAAILDLWSCEVAGRNALFLSFEMENADVLK